MQFGFTLKPDHTLERTLALTRQAEAAGFDYGWLFDSHVLWREPYVLLTLMAQATRRLRLGTCVTNPATREPSVTASAAGGARRDVGRPDGSRHRARRLGPAGARQAADHDGHPRGGDRRHQGARRGTDDRVRGDGAPPPVDRPLDAPGVGRGLRPDGPGDDRSRGRRDHPPAGRPGPHPLVRRPGPRGRRRPPGATRRRSGSRRPRPATSARARSGRERTRWFPALVSNHVVDLVNKYPREQLPAA